MVVKLVPSFTRSGLQWVAPWLLAVFSCGGSDFAAVAPNPASSAAEQPKAAVPLTEPRLVASDQHACHLSAAGAVRCWGDITGMPSNQAAVAVFGEKGPFISVGVTRFATCAVASNGQLSCIPASKAEGAPADLIAVDGDCVLTRAGAVYVHTYDTWSLVAGLEGVRSVACSMVYDGDVRGYALTARGVVEFIADEDRAYVEPLEPQRAGAVSVSMGGDLDCVRTQTALDCGELREGVVSAASRDRLECEVRVDGSVHCKGNNTRLAIQRDSDYEAVRNDWVPSWKRMEGVSDAVEVVIGQGPCVRRRGGEVLCWGPWEHYQPSQVVGLDNAVALAAGFYNSMLALRADGTAVRWGRSSEKEGLSNWFASSSPRSVGKRTNLIGISQNLLLSSDGGVWELFGTSDYKAPQPVKDASALSERTRGSTCVLTNAGVVWCWDGREAPSPVGIDDAKAVAVGGGFACALRANGTVSCWGAGARGGLGRGVSADAQKPSPVPGLEGVVSISASDDAACAVGGDGRVTCWGFNNQRIIDPNREQSAVLSPTQLAIQDVRSVALDSLHACAILLNGRVSCWGRRSVVTLGGADESTPLPRLVDKLEAVDEVVVGFNFACARTGGRVHCWGENKYGQMGDGTGLWTPKPIAGLE